MSPPPRFARALLFCLAPADDRAFIVGDLDDEFVARVARRGRLVAVGWYVMQVLLSIAPLLRLRMEVRPNHLRHGPSSMTIGNMLAQTVSEFRLAARTLLRRWRFSTTAIATFSTGIAGFTLIYGTVSGVLLRPLSYPRSDALVSVYQVLPQLRNQRGMERRWNSFGFSYGGLRALESGAPAFETVGAISGASKILTNMGPPEPVSVLRVSATAFDLLDIKPIRGHAFTNDDTKLGSAPVALIAHDMWRARFGSRNDILGQILRLDSTAYTIVGVLPKSATLPGSATPGIWIPIGGEPDDLLPRKTPLNILGRLRPGATLEAARLQAANVLRAFDPGQDLDARVAQWQTELTSEVRSPLLFLLGASVLLLALTCVSVAGLFATELQSRLTEFATRNAIGATRWRLLRQLLSETILLSACAAVVGIIAAYMALPALKTLGVTAVPQLRMARLDVLAASTAALIATAAAVLICVIGATVVVGHSPATQLTAHRIGGVRKKRFAAVVLGGQFALAALLLVGGGLLGLNLFRINAIQPGFDADNLFVVNLDLGAAARSSATALPPLEEMSSALRAMPGVSRVAIGSAIPFSGGNSSGSIAVEHHGRADTVNVRFSSVIPGLIETLGLRLVAGRLVDSTDSENGMPIAVINETMAREFWPNESPIGQTVVSGDRRQTIVGVVSDVRHTSVLETTLPTVYLAERQKHSRFLQLLVRMTCAERGTCERTLLVNVRSALAQVLPLAVVQQARPMRELVARSFAGDRFRATLTVLFALIAGIVTVVGIYGTTARSAQQRQREIAIRIALGGTVANTTGRFIRPLVVIAAAGSSIGLAAALLGADFVRPYVRLVGVRDLSVYGLVGGMLVVVALLAATWAALRTTRLSPARILKES